MSTTPLCQVHHQGIGKCNSVGACEFHRWKHSRARNHVFFRVMWLQGSPKYRVSVTAGAGLDLGKLLTKGAQDCSESSISKKTRKKNWGMVKSTLLSLRRFGATLLRDCNRLWQNTLARLCAGKHRWCCDAPALRDCTWRLLSALQQLRER